MTDKIDTSKLGRIDLASGKSPPIEECVSTWAVDDRIQSLIADNERLRGALKYAQALLRRRGVMADTVDAALSHKDMSK